MGRTKKLIVVGAATLGGIALTAFRLGVAWFDRADAVIGFVGVISFFAVAAVKDPAFWGVLSLIGLCGYLCRDDIRSAFSALHHKPVDAPKPSVAKPAAGVPLSILFSRQNHVLPNAGPGPMAQFRVQVKNDGDEPVRSVMLKIESLTPLERASQVTTLSGQFNSHPLRPSRWRDMPLDLSPGESEEYIVCQHERNSPTIHFSGWQGDGKPSMFGCTKTRYRVRLVATGLNAVPGYRDFVIAEKDNGDIDFDSV